MLTGAAAHESARRADQFGCQAIEAGETVGRCQDLALAAWGPTAASVFSGSLFVAPCARAQLRTSESGPQHLSNAGWEPGTSLAFGWPALEAPARADGGQLPWFDAQNTANVLQPLGKATANGAASPGGACLTSVGRVAGCNP